MNLSVNRREHASAFDVNCAGTYHCLLAAVASGHRRFVNTAPHFSVIGSGYEDADFRITEDAPPHPGVNLYAISKGLGVELCRVFARNHPLEVLCALFYNLPAGGSPAPGAPPDVTPFSVTFPDAAQAILRCVEVGSERLPAGGAFHAFFILAPLPHNKFASRKAREVLGWRAQDSLREYFTRGPRL